MLYYARELLATLVVVCIVLEYVEDYAYSREYCIVAMHID